SNETLKDQEPIFKNVSLDDYMWVYIWMVLALMVMAVTRVVWFRLAQTAASRRLHNRMFNAVVKTSISFFDKNPIGRILNRFSKDVGAMDEQLAFVFFDFLTGTLNFLGMVAVIVAINPLIFAPTLPLVLLFFFLRYYYLQTSRDIKRLESTSELT
uniref:ABC transmembrane type-1 domain-containing protein n=1 Tax=Plectus sambesii TaxID=2011161 RepID=A0A914VEV8_9BILA